MTIASWLRSPRRSTAAHLAVPTIFLLRRDAGTCDLLHSGTGTRKMRWLATQGEIMTCQWISGRTRSFTWPDNSCQTLQVIAPIRLPRNVRARFWGCAGSTASSSPIILTQRRWFGVLATGIFSFLKKKKKRKKDVKQAEAVATLMREAPLLHENEHAVKAGGQLLLQQFLYCAELSTEAEGS